MIGTLDSSVNRCAAGKIAVAEILEDFELDFAVTAPEIY
jgi:hypothetical protein